MKTREFQGTIRKRQLGLVSVIALLIAYLWPILCYTDLFHKQELTVTNLSFGTIAVDCPVENTVILRSDAGNAHDCISPEEVASVVTKKSSGSRTITPEPTTYSTVDANSLHLQSFDPLNISRLNLLYIPQTSLFAVKTALLFYD